MIKKKKKKEKKRKYHDQSRRHAYEQIVFFCSDQCLAMINYSEITKARNSAEFTSVGQHSKAEKGRQNH